MSQLTLMAVHAHPDDEVVSTGGVLARYAAERVHTVLVTCTDGEQGDGPGGVKPGEAGHDTDAVRARRLEELRQSCAQLGVGSVELLGYADSGMAGWAANHAPDAFANLPLATAAARICALIERYRPQVVVTYGPDGMSGHPDHLQAHRATLVAVRTMRWPIALYFTAVPRSAIARLRAAFAADGPDPAAGLGPDFGTPDEQITTRIDVSGYVAHKKAALAAHASQTTDFFLLRLPEPLLDQALATESFVRADPHPSPPGELEADLFCGLR